MDIGTGLAIGIPAGSAVLGVILKLVPNRNGCRQVGPLDECMRAFHRIEVKLDRQDETVTRIDLEVAKQGGRLERLLNGRKS